MNIEEFYRRALAIWPDTAFVTERHGSHLNNWAFSVSASKASPAAVVGSDLDAGTALEKYKAWVKEQPTPEQIKQRKIKALKLQLSQLKHGSAMPEEGAK